MALGNSELNEVLLQLLAEVQHLRVDYARLEARVSGKPTGTVLLEVEKAAKEKIVAEHKDLIAKIEAL